jgi:hypothetical protein
MRYGYVDEPEPTRERGSRELGPRVPTTRGGGGRPSSESCDHASTLRWPSRWPPAVPARPVCLSTGKTPKPFHPCQSRTSENSRLEGLDFLNRARFLSAKVVAPKTEDVEPFRARLTMQLLELFVLRSVSAFARRVHYETDLATVNPQICRLAVECLRVQLIKRLDRPDTGPWWRWANILGTGFSFFLARPRMPRSHGLSRRWHGSY